MAAKSVVQIISNVGREINVRVGTKLVGSESIVLLSTITAR